MSSIPEHRGQPAARESTGTDHPKPCLDIFPVEPAGCDNDPVSLAVCGLPRAGCRARSSRFAQADWTGRLVAPLQVASGARSTPGGGNLHQETPPQFYMSRPSTQSGTSKRFRWRYSLLSRSASAHGPGAPAPGLLDLDHQILPRLPGMMRLAAVAATNCIRRLRSGTFSASSLNPESDTVATTPT